MTPESRKLLTDGIKRLEISVPETVLGKLEHYLDSLMKWNRAFNLTAIREEKEMVIKHLLDSLAALPWLTGKSVIDVGTGAGLPGMVLAIVRPEIQVTLLDSNSKKTRFLLQMVGELQLTNVKVVHSRVEEYREQTYDTVTSRAFASLADMLHWCAHLQNEAGRFAAMKGRYPAEEIAELPAGFKVVDVPKMTVPFLDDERHMVLIEKN